MKKFRRLISVLLLIVLAVPTVGVFAKEGMSMTIKGPGIKGEVTLMQSDLMMRLEDSGFFGFSGNITAIKPLENPGEGYTITAAIIEQDQPIPFVELVYYPAEKDEAGYVHYVSRVNGDSLQTVDEWGQLPLSADQAFRRLMEANNIALQTAVHSAPAAETVKQPQAHPEVQPANASPVVASPMQVPYLAITGIAVLLALGAGLLLRKRVTSQRSI